MSNEFTITVASNSLQLDQQRQGSVTYTAFNASGRPLTGRASLKTAPENQPHGAWLRIDGADERTFAIGAAEQFTVRVLVPAEVTTGNYTIRLNMVDVANTDEGVSEGPTVTIAVPASTPAPKKRPIGLMALLAALGLIIIAAAIFFFLRPRSLTMPDVAGLTEADAEATLVAAGLQIGRVREESSEQIAAGLVARTEPEQNAPIGKATPVSLFISAGANVTPTATPDLPATVQAMATQTADAIAQAAATATAQAQAQADAQAMATATADALLAAAIGKYTRTWVKQNDGDVNEISNLEITRSDNNVTIVATGDFKTIVGSAGGLASAPCTNCVWGQTTQAYSGDPLNLEIQADTGLRHKLTLAVVPEGNLLSVTDQIYNGDNRVTVSTYTLKPSRLIVMPVATFIMLPAERFQLNDINLRAIQVITSTNP